MCGDVNEVACNGVAVSNTSPRAAEPGQAEALCETRISDASPVARRQNAAANEWGRQWTPADSYHISRHIF
jgi:hypothetical protein